MVSLCLTGFLFFSFFALLQCENGRRLCLKLVDWGVLALESVTVIVKGK